MKIWLETIRTIRPGVPLLKFSKPLASVKQDVIKAREELSRAQDDLLSSIMDPYIIERVKFFSEEVIRLNELKRVS